jgi:hypothetical protein
MHCDKINRHPIKGDIINFGDESIAQVASTFIQKKSQIFNVCQGLYFTIFQVKLEEEFYSFFFVRKNYFLLTMFQSFGILLLYHNVQIPSGISRLCI